MSKKSRHAEKQTRHAEKKAEHHEHAAFEHEAAALHHREAARQILQGNVDRARRHAAAAHDHGSRSARKSEQEIVYERAWAASVSHGDGRWTGDPAELRGDAAREREMSAHDEVAQRASSERIAPRYQDGAEDEYRPTAR